LDSEDLHCLRSARSKAVKKDIPFSWDLLYQDETTFREIASILRCDLSLIISEFEMELLQNLFSIKSDIIQFIPLFSEKADNSTPKSFKNRSGFVTIGNFLHEPNFDSVRYLKSHIWPLIRQKMPDSVMNVYGSYATTKAFEMHDPSSGFLVHGRTDDAEEVLANARVLLAPLRFGAGLKGKLLDAMRVGTPIVTTSIGAEGMFGTSPIPGFIEDDPTQFAEKAVELYQQEERWNNAQQAGFEIIENRFNRNDFSGNLIDRILTIRKELQLHRTRNFYGSMLHHKTLTSTKYLSRWIEEKNKNRSALPPSE